MLPSVRKTYFLIFIACTLMMLAAAYMEHVMKMIPCSLCITQRGFVVLTGSTGTWQLQCITLHPLVAAFMPALALSAPSSVPVLPVASSGCKVCLPIRCPPAAPAWLLYV